MVRIRLKKLGRKHRPFFRICAMDVRSPRDGKAIEELGIYDPMVKDTDARVRLNNERVAYWLSVGAQPSEKVAILIKKYGPNGTHLEAQANAQTKLAEPKKVPPPPKPVELPKPQAPEVAAEGAEPTADQTETPAAGEQV
jgi:small subunit ribosomal protein S16